MSKLQEREIMCALVLREKGLSVRQIARQLGVDESTVRYHLNRRKTKVEDGRRGKPEACTPWKNQIDPWLLEQKLRIESGQRPYSVRSLYEHLRDECGYAGSYKAVLRYVRRRLPRPAFRPHRRVETRPGAQGQVDWAEHNIFVQDLGGRVKLYSFVLTLSWSRMFAWIWSSRMDQASWLRCHNEALRFLGGVPYSLRIDNLKTGVKRGSGAWAELNDSYSSYADQVGFIIDPCRVRSPVDKGKVERRISDGKQALIRPGERFPTLVRLQEITTHRVLERSERLLCPVTGDTVAVSWRRERQHLLPLPDTLPEPFDTAVRRPVQRDCTVRFEGHTYSTPFTYALQQVTVRGCGAEVQIWSDGELLRRYPRHTKCRMLIDQSCYEGPSTDRVLAPHPLGKLGRTIVLEKSWEAPQRPLVYGHPDLRT